MTHADDREWLLQKYLRGELTGADVARFEQLAREDESCTDEIAFRQAVKKTLAESQSEARLAEFEAFKKRHSKKK